MNRNDNRGVLKLRRRTEEMLNRSMASLKKMSASEIRNLLEDLQIYQVELEEQNGRLLKVQAELKETSEALLQSETRYRTLFHESREAKSLAKNGKIVEVNAKWLELHGFDNEEDVLGKDVLQFIYESDRGILKDRRKRWPEKLEAVYQLRDIRKDGSIVDVEVYSSRILLDGEVAILATIHDISDRKRLEEQTRKISKMEALATLAGGIAQHFNNALSVITAHNGILEMNFPDNQEVMRCVKPMKQAADRMANLTQQLLACGLGGRYNPTEILISDHVKSILLSARGDIPDSVQLTFKSAPDLPRVTADSRQISMALSAVIENAIEAVEGAGVVRIRCQRETLNAAFQDEHTKCAPGSYVCLEVEDNGKGMDPETLERIFDPFFTTHFVGRGLGLSAAYGIVKNHNGFISIESEIQSGTAVRLYLPVADTEDGNPKKGFQSFPDEQF